MSLDNFQVQAPNQEQASGGNERPEYKVSKFVNITLFGAIEVKARIFEDPTKQRGMSSIQKRHHKNLSQVSAEEIEALIQDWLAKGKSPVAITSVNDANPEVNEDDDNFVASLFAK